ncbi:SAM-dependent methyltransferase [Phytoactinopolyspora limicola]|uniref:SAM-dependent methyltransferase n=1 Tax=Phytoactinopolyspora limicola TaxID=2715536 RepID=UPI00140DFA1C|nr:class I SAM-dependent methyltransferase [Phytoactinopolyspora limicola]
MFDKRSLFGPFAEIERLALPETTLSTPFEGLLGLFYTTLVTRAHDDSSWFADHAGPPGAAGALDLCCGGGRSALELARKGWQVTGVDQSATQLGAARRLMRTAESEVTDRISLVRGDILTLDLDSTFDVVVIGGLSMTLFEPEQRMKTYAAVRRHLGAGGRFLFDYIPYHPGESEREAVIAFPIRSQGRRGFVLVGARRDPVQQRQVTNMYAELVGAEGGTQRTLTGFEFRLDEPAQLMAELAGNGFRLRHGERCVTDEGDADAETPFGSREYVVAEVAG